MKKIRLDAEELQVSSFAVSPAMAARPGTVRANHTGYTCYETVGYYQTMCLAYPVSYWGEESCDCGPWEDTDPRVCDLDTLVCPVATNDPACAVDTAITCLGQPGC